MTTTFSSAFPNRQIRAAAYLVLPCLALLATPPAKGQDCAARLDELLGARENFQQNELFVAVCSEGIVEDSVCTSDRSEPRTDIVSTAHALEGGASLMRLVERLRGPLSMCFQYLGSQWCVSSTGEINTCRTTFVFVAQDSVWVHMLDREEDHHPRSSPILQVGLAPNMAELAYFAASVAASIGTEVETSPDVAKD
jgi:hypothetical protein